MFKINTNLHALFGSVMPKRKSSVTSTVTTKNTKKRQRTSTDTAWIALHHYLQRLPKKATYVNASEENALWWQEPYQPLFSRFTQATLQSFAQRLKPDELTTLIQYIPTYDALKLSEQNILKLLSQKGCAAVTLEALEQHKTLIAVWIDGYQLVSCDEEYVPDDHTISNHPGNVYLYLDNDNVCWAAARFSEPNGILRAIIPSSYFSAEENPASILDLENITATILVTLRNRTVLNDTQTTWIAANLELKYYCLETPTFSKKQIIRLLSSPSGAKNLAAVKLKLKWTPSFGQQTSRFKI